MNLAGTDLNQSPARQMKMAPYGAIFLPISR
jgi:hypothetical protein